MYGRGYQQQVRFGPPHTPDVIKWLLIANVGVFVLQHVVAGFTTWFAAWPVRFWSGALWQPFTYMWLHSPGSLMHIGFNMLALWMFGSAVASAWGTQRFLRFYLICGIVASLAQVLVNTSSNVPGVGASGAIAGVLAAYILLFGSRPVRVLMGGILTSVPSYVMIGLWIVTQVLSGFGSLGQDGGGVAYWAHIGGFVAGLVLTFLLRRMVQPHAAGAPARSRRMLR